MSAEKKPTWSIMIAHNGYLNRWGGYYRNEASASARLDGAVASFQRRNEVATLELMKHENGETTIVRSITTETR